MKLARTGLLLCALLLAAAPIFAVTPPAVSPMVPPGAPAATAALDGSIAGPPDGQLSATELLLFAGLVLVGSVGSVLCSGAEMGGYSINRVRLSLRTSGDRPEPNALTLRREVENAPRFLAVLLVGNNLFNYLVSVGLTAYLHDRGYGELGITIITIFLVTPVTFVLLDTLPKEVFRSEADTVMYRVAPLLRALRMLLTFSLILPAIQALAHSIASLFGGAGASAQSARDRIATLLKEGARHGVLTDHQITLLDRALALREATVADEMIPWARTASIPAAWEPARALDFVAARGWSRYPVVDARGRLAGVVDQFDLCLSPNSRPADLAKPACLLEEHLSVREGLVRLMQAGTAMAVVVRGGKPVGIVTAKDLVEPLTGELKAW